MENPIKNGWFEGTFIFLETPIYAPPISLDKKQLPITSMCCKHELACHPRKKIKDFGME